MAYVSHRLERDYKCLHTTKYNYQIGSAWGVAKPDDSCLHTERASMSVLAKRLKEARLRAGLSQERLGIEAGLDPMSASTRMNRYELGKRMPDPLVVEQLAAILRVPVAYLHSVDDEEAELLLKFHRLNKKQRAKVIAFVDEVSG